MKKKKRSQKPTQVQKWGAAARVLNWILLATAFLMLLAVCCFVGYLNLVNWTLQYSHPRQIQKMLTACDERLVFNESYYHPDPLGSYYEGEGFVCYDYSFDCECNDALLSAHGVE